MTQFKIVKQSKLKCIEAITCPFEKNVNVLRALVNILNCEEIIVLGYKGDKDIMKRDLLTCTKEYPDRIMQTNI